MQMTVPLLVRLILILPGVLQTILRIRHLILVLCSRVCQGGELVNGDPNYNETKRYNKSYNTNRWLSPMFPGDGKTPYSTVGFNWMLTDYVIEDASYYCIA